MTTLYTTLMIIIAAVLLVGLILSIRYGNRQKVHDHGVDPSIKRNPMAKNPIVWAYIFGAALFFLLIWVFKMYHNAPF
ncbi:hypothetical protein [Ammoniphilus resinae]|uniref:Secreted protein n=1 Tax=Ammoniphilus resinae TaxID=861532 RepID=A0ABS4GLQ7_9BACL|nr:hypothetical protein [Ammoniphilus resinae]MBP1931198.1 putative secreted protein [Ammoniphilus resinae]